MNFYTSWDPLPIIFGKKNPVPSPWIFSPGGSLFAPCRDQKLDLAPQSLHHQPMFGQKNHQPMFGHLTAGFEEGGGGGHKLKP